VIADRLHRETTNGPQGKSDQGDGADRTPAARIKRGFGKARRNKAFNIDVLPVSAFARPIECFERMLVSGLGKFPLGIERLVRTELRG
jgi:hypothetical protein